MKKNFKFTSLQAIRKAAAIIRYGGVGAFPTETVYGLGANALDPKAVARIFEIKNRPYFDPLIVHVESERKARDLFRVVPSSAAKLMKAFWPGPLTLVLPKKKIIPDLVTSGLDSVAVRVPAHSNALRFLKACQVPVAAPSANPFGYLSPTTAEHVRRQIGKKIDFILDSGRCPVGLESTVIGFEKNKPVLLRPGGVSIEQIEKIVGPVAAAKNKSKIQAPGQLARHYSPRTPIEIMKGQVLKPSAKKLGFLAFQKKPTSAVFKKVEILSNQGNLTEAAANLFYCLHRLDRAGLDMIYAEPLPDNGLGLAMMDRLRRAEGKRNRFTK